MRARKTTTIDSVQGRFGQSSRHWQPICYAVMVLIGFSIGAAIGTPQKADAGIRKGSERETFLSGGARSEKVLRDIAAIVARMDGRIANIEKAISQAAGAGKRQ